MKKHLETIANKIKNGVRVYLCPASLETILTAKMLKREYGVLPNGFCDNDIRKHNRKLNSFPELNIFSFDDIVIDNEDVFFVVSPFHSADIIGNLTVDRKVSPSRVINYQPVERKKTCARFAQNWIIEDRYFVCCCIEEYKPRFDNKSPDVQMGIEYIDNMRKSLIDGSARLPQECKKCFNNKEGYIYESRKLNSFNFSFRGWCNYKCQYCSASHPDLKAYNNKFALEEYLIEIEKRGMANDVFSVLNAVGEPTLNEKRFLLYDYCREKQFFLDMFTNLSVFDGDLFELAHSSPVILRKSFDAGTSSTYFKIKGVNFFEKVIANTKKYLQAPYLVLNPKYLFVPGINDNETDILEFVKLCINFNVDFVTPVFSILDSKYYDSEKAKKMFSMLVGLLAENNILTANVDTLYSEKYHNIYSKSFEVAHEKNYSFYSGV